MAASPVAGWLRGVVRCTAGRGAGSSQREERYLHEGLAGLGSWLLVFIGALWVLIGFMVWVGR